MSQFEFEQWVWKIPAYLGVAQDPIGTQDNLTAIRTLVNDYNKKLKNVEDEFSSNAAMTEQFG